LSFDRSGEALALGSSDGAVHIWDVERKKQLREIRGVGHIKRVSSMSWNRSVLSPYLISSGG
jgi:cell division cycle protein 20 (cofactor of APC complex)